MYEKGIVSQACDSNTPSFSITTSNHPSQRSLRSLNHHRSLPMQKLKNNLLLTVPKHVITMTKSNQAVGNVPGSTKQSRAFKVSIE